MDVKDRTKFTSLIPQAVKKAEREGPTSQQGTREVRIAKSLLKDAGISATKDEIVDRLRATKGSHYFKLYKSLQKRKRQDEFRQSRNEALMDQDIKRTGKVGKTTRFAGRPRSK